ncbi:hypothetical protein [Pseudoxanthomonas sp. UTMC 1351]|uniref:hypothetical protein n=1 Tax=Pseudoxanthomonas sp. UTMC 1351 TaxID=2695853 RepID=UPI0034CF99F4
MNSVLIRHIGFALAVLLITGCNRSEPQAPEVGAAPTAASAPASGQLVAELKASEPSIKTQVGTKEQGDLAATGKKGVLAHGPYQKLGPGRYLLTVEGATSTPFVLDVVSARAQNTHGRKRVAPGKDAVPLTSLPFDLPTSVDDLEIRVIVPEGADTKLIGYKIVRR